MEEKDAFVRLQDFRIRDYQTQLEKEKEEHEETKRELEITKEKLSSVEERLNSLVCFCACFPITIIYYSARLNFSLYY